MNTITEFVWQPRKLEESKRLKKKKWSISKNINFWYTPSDFLSKKHTREKTKGEWHLTSDT